MVLLLHDVSPLAHSTELLLSRLTRVMVKQLMLVVVVVTAVVMLLTTQSSESRDTVSPLTNCRRYNIIRHCEMSRKPDAFQFNNSEAY